MPDTILAAVPAPLWGVVGVAIGGVVTLMVAVLNGRRDSLEKRVARLEARVESLEEERDAYRSWSHVLWFHIHDLATPRTPAPVWPEDLPR